MSQQEKLRNFEPHEMGKIPVKAGTHCPRPSQAVSQAVLQKDPRCKSAHMSRLKKDSDQQHGLG
jgi:hypothetical protein